MGNRGRTSTFPPSNRLVVLGTPRLPSAADSPRCRFLPSPLVPLVRLEQLLPRLPRHIARKVFKVALFEHLINEARINVADGIVDMEQVAHATENLYQDLDALVQLR